MHRAGGAERAELGAGPLESWLRRLRKRSSNPEDQLRLGAVSEALGDQDAALRAYRTAAGHKSVELAGASHWALLAAGHGDPSEREEALAAVLRVSRARLEDLIDSSPDDIDADSRLAAVQVLRGLESLSRVAAAVGNTRSAGSEDIFFHLPAPVRVKTESLVYSLSAPPLQTPRIKISQSFI